MAIPVHRVVFESFGPAAVDAQQQFISIDLHSAKALGRPMNVRLGIAGLWRLHALIVCLLHLGDAMKHGHSGAIQLPTLRESRQVPISLGEFVAAKAPESAHVALTLHVGGLPLNGLLTPETARRLAADLLDAAAKVDAGRPLH